jgi:molecular chaperone Hsp33
LTDTIKPAELVELDNISMLQRLYSQEEVRLFEGTPVTFRCTCSVKRCENAILVLGQEEAEQELEGKQAITVTCEFCNKEYNFDRVDVAAIFKNGGHAQSSTQVH